jgi:hypothetical protein
LADLDADGRTDFVALFCQEHESVVAFLNRGDGRFEDVTASWGLAGDRDWPTSAAFADLDERRVNCLIAYMKSLASN